MFSEEFRQKLYASAASKMRNGKPLSVEEQAATLYALDQAAQQSVHLTGLCVCPEEWSVDIHGNCSNCGLAKSPRK